jgi:hypothetical protein
MELNKIKQRLELALKPAKPPTIEEVLEEVSTHGVLRGDLLQLGWRASDESELDSRPFMQTAQPWQMFAWAAARYGELYTLIASVTLTHEGMSNNVYIKAKSWKQRWSKDEAVGLVASHLRRGEWAPLFTAWLGDEKARWKTVLRGKYVLSIATKEPWRLGLVASTYEALSRHGQRRRL